MSSYKSNTKSNKQVPQCAHCTNLNRSRATPLPTDHYLRDNRDPNHRVICPVLKSTYCTNCGNKGHTRSHCTVDPERQTEKLMDQLYASIEREYVAVRQSRMPTQPLPLPVKNIKNNAFGVLDCDSDDEEEAEKEEETRPDSPTTTPPPLRKISNWADYVDSDLDDEEEDN